jgi:hypothetical protein
MGRGAEGAGLVAVWACCRVGVLPVRGEGTAAPYRARLYVLLGLDSSSVIRLTKFEHRKTEVNSVFRSGN